MVRQSTEEELQGYLTHKKGEKELQGYLTHKRKSYRDTSLIRRKSYRGTSLIG